MMFFENLKMALASLRRAKTRSFLTMLGIIIGVASVTSVMAIGQGVKHAVVGEVGALGTNLLQVTPGKSFGGENSGENKEGGGGGFNFAASLGASTITEKDVKTANETEGVEAAVPFMIVSGNAKAGDKTASGTIVYGTTPDFMRVFNQKVSHGQFFTNNSAKEAVIGSKVAEQLFGSNEAALGKTLTMRQQSLKIVGVFEKPAKESAFSGFSFSAGVMLPLDVAKTFNNGLAQIIEVDIKAKAADQVVSVKKRLQERIKANHDGQDDFTVMTQDEQLKVFDTILALLTSFIAAIAAISLVVGGVGIMNIMLVSVTERTREIGIRKAIGASRRAILGQFLIEAVTLSILGGALGVAAAYGLGLIVKRFADLTPIFTPDTIILAVTVSAGVGIVFGIAPAIKAARKRPIEALRAE